MKEASTALPAIEMTPKVKKTKKQKKKERQEAKKQKQDEPKQLGDTKLDKSVQENLQISISSEGQRTISSTSKNSPPEVHEDSNSNYSFSEFYKSQQQKSPVDDTFKSPGEVSTNESSFEKVIKAVKENLEESKTLVPHQLVKNPMAMVALPDFIPLTRVENTHRKTQIEREPEQIVDARVLLSKENYRHLSNGKGMLFLADLQTRLEVHSQFMWDKAGNSLLISGFPSNQSIFHLEIREYLYRIELERHEKMIESTSQLPRNKASIVTFLKTNLQSINKMKHFGIKKLIDGMAEAERALDPKKLLKCRRSLNIAFIGHGELEEGGTHVGALRRILYTMEKELVQGKTDMTVELRQEITDHMRPIFSPANYGDYQKLFEQYTKAIKQRGKRKMLPNPILMN